MRKKSRLDNVEWVSVMPLGQDGLDYFTSSALLPATALQLGENIRLEDDTLARRKGAEIIYRASNVTASKTFGATTKYGTIAAASQLELPTGGFALMLHFTAVRPSASNTGYILSSRVNGQSYHVMSVTISDSGVITVSWTKSSDSSSVSIATSAVDAAATVHLLAIFDAVAGTFTVYVNGASSGTPVTGIATTEKPIAASGTAWHVGAHYDPGVAGVVANTNFDGKVDGLCLLTLSGIDPTAGSATLTATLLKHSFRQWPTPQMDAVVFCYDFDSSSTTSDVDRSRHKNNMTLTGTPTASSAEVALASIPTNFVGRVQRPDGTRTNLIGSYGRVFYEDVAAAT